MLNDFGGGHNQAVIGMTPNSMSKWTKMRRTIGSDNNYDGSTTAGDPYQLRKEDLGRWQR